MISVVIPAYNEEELIGKCLDSLVAQKTSEEFEVILVDNNSTDNTSKIAESYQGKLNLRIILEKEKGRGTARYAGFKQAQGLIILSLDADTTAPPDWIDKMIGPLGSRQAVATTGPCQFCDGDKFTNTIMSAFQPNSMRLYRLFLGHYWLSGFNFAITKEAYDQSGGFHPKINAQEDIELTFKVNKIGKIKFLPNAVVTASGRRFRKGMIRGFLPYITTYISYFFLKKDNPILSDVR
ncbi:MAG: glycosyltransferase [bacterium]|nr:glycosyltransferase [bacterium]